MTRDAFVRRLALSVAAALTLSLVLQTIAGPRWFDFYGWAAVALVLVALVGGPLLGRLRAQGYPRWPAMLVLGAAAIAALVQIGFWLAFFGLGQKGITLGMGRSMFLEMAGPWLPWAAGVLAGAMAWLTIRAAGPDFKPR